MMLDNDEDKFEAWLRDAAKTYHEPPEGTAPREQMWARIEAERARRAKRRVIELRPWLRWTLAAAALFAVGIGIGRWTAVQETIGRGATSVASAEPNTAGISGE